MGRSAVIGAVCIAGALAAPISALAGYGTPPPGSGSPPADANVNANGNAITGGLGYAPRRVTVKVGQTVRWTNTDSIAPHTSTEDHRLWRLSGDYGPPGAQGYGPGESVQRRFAAGTWSYFCEIHPVEMHGTVAVPVTLRRGAQSGTGGVPVSVIWSKTALPAGQVFDVQERVGARPWRTVRKGTRIREASFLGRPGRVLSFRARVRRAADAAATSGYSPAARIRLG